MDTNLLLSRFGSSTEAIQLFEDSEEPTDQSANLIRVFLEEFFWEHTIWFYSRDFLGYYQVDFDERIVRGLWPVNYKETVFLFLYLSTLVFDKPDVDSTMRWIRDTGKYSRHLDLTEWRKACDAIEKLIQGSLVVENSA